MTDNTLEKTPFVAMEQAVRMNDVGMFRNFLANGADPDIADEQERNILWIAAGTGRAKIVQLLIDHNAEIDKKVKDSTTPLQICVQNGPHVDVLCLLIARGAEVNTVNHLGVTPLMDAAMKDSLAVVDLLLNSGADIYASAPDGWTALRFAQTADKAPEIIKLLEDWPEVLRQREAVAASHAASTQSQQLITATAASYTIRRRSQL